MRVVDRSMKSFLGLLKAISIGRCDQKPKLPNYLPALGYFPLIIPRIKLRDDGTFAVPMSQQFKREYGEVRITLPERLKDKNIKEVRIHPKYQARWFEVEYIYEVASLEETSKACDDREDEKIETSVNSDIAIAIDLGVDNLCACIDTDGHQFLIDGKRLKSINQWYNKRNAQLQSAKDKQGINSFTHKQARLCQWRNNCVRDYLNKAARLIIDHCLKHQIGKLVVGYNPGIKQEINIGKSNNQNFVQIPFWQLRRKLEALCSRYGIEYLEQEESYTSKASFYDRDEIPVYNADNPSKHKFSGRRIKRGLYRTKNKHLVSSDINGSANILVKSKHRLDFQRVSSGFLANPLRIFVS
jgi:IS605 OrfB family transposase